MLLKTIKNQYNKHFWMGLFLLLAGSNLFAQSGKKIFDPSFVHEIHLTIADTNFWEELLTNYGDSSSFSGSDIDWTLVNAMVIDGTKLDSVALRLKGKSSYRYASAFKKPLKIDLNELVKGQDYDGMKKFNLHNGACDPSMLRDFLAYDVMRKAGVKAPRVAPVKLFINEQYWGLYNLIEQIDKTFLKNNFSNGKGNLYKNNGWSRLEWLGTDITAYQEDIELKTNEEEDDDDDDDDEKETWSDFIEFVDILNNSKDAEFAEAIQKVFNVDLFLRALAVDIALNNWDSYVENQRNWYIYHNPDTDLFEWIPWDYNLSMGGDFMFTANPFRAYDPDCKTLSEFQYYLRDGNAFFVDKSEPRADTWHWDFGNGETSNLPSPSFNFGTQQEVEVCLTVGRFEGDELCEHTRCKNVVFDETTIACTFDSGQVAPYPVTDPIFQIIIREDAFCCTNAWDAVCELKYQNILNGTDAIEELGVEYDVDLPLFIEDTSKVLIVRLMAVPEFRQRFLDLTCVLMDNNFTKSRLSQLIDEQAALMRPHIYEEPFSFFSKDFYEYDVGNGTGGGNEVNIPALKYFLDTRIEQMQTHLEQEGKNCQEAASAIQWQDISINEFVASNKDSIGGIADAAGEFDDWIELYNNTDEAINLQGYFLSDNFDKPLKWTFPPNTIIGAKDYLVVWADKDEDQSGLHAAFKLERNGEQLILSHEDATVIDSFSFGAQKANLAMARIPNGKGDLVQQQPTFNKNNEVVSSLPNTTFSKLIKIYPNPSNDFIKIDFMQLPDNQVNIVLRNALGQIVLNELIRRESYQLDSRKYANGTYFLEFHVEEEMFSEKLIISH